MNIVLVEGYASYQHPFAHAQQEKDKEVLNPTEPRPVDRYETKRVDERTALTGGLVPAPARLDQAQHTEQGSQSTAAIEKRERLVTDRKGFVHRKRAIRDAGAEYHSVLLMTGQMVWLAVGIIDGLIGLRVLLKLIGANPDNGFASFVYNFAGVFLSPFFGLIGSPASEGMVLEVPSLIAMLVYALVGGAIAVSILPLFERSTTRSSSTYDS